MEDLKEDTKSSSMRVNNRIVVYAACSLIAGILFHICYATIAKSTIDWDGLGVFTIGVASLITGTFTAKAIQKKYEK